MSTMTATAAGDAPERDICAEAFALVCQTADLLRERGERGGLLLVIGDFTGRLEIQDARDDLYPNPFRGRDMNVFDKAFHQLLLAEAAVGKGAVVADGSGRILGGGIMLVIEHLDVVVPNGCFMRHLAAASTSIRADIQCVITLSEETNLVRRFVSGRAIATYDPSPTKPETE